MIEHEYITSPSPKDGEKQAGSRQFPIFLGVLAYEFRMQIRRRSLWLIFGFFALVLENNVFSGFNNPEIHLQTMPLLQLVAYMTAITNWVTPLGIGVVLADRLPRDKSHQVDELLESTPGRLRTRLLGKYCGCVLASLTPALILNTITMSVIAYLRHTLLVLPLSLLTYSVIALPGIMFIAAFTFAFTSIMWTPLYQFLFVGYWFWGNLLSPQAGLPTLSNTILTPIGTFICAGIFGIAPEPWAKGAGPLEGLASLLVLLVIPALVMLLLFLYLKREKAGYAHRDRGTA